MSDIASAGDEHRGLTTTISDLFDFVIQLRDRLDDVTLDRDEKESILWPWLLVRKAFLGAVYLGLARPAECLEESSIDRDGARRKLDQLIKRIQAHQAANPTGTKNTEGGKPPTNSTQAPVGAEKSEGGTPPKRFVPLTSWADIFAALNEPHGTGNAAWKNTQQKRDTVRKLNDIYSGPICFPQGKGKQPRVDKAALMIWWDKCREHFDARNEIAASKDKSSQLTVADSHNYGTSGTVVPGIGGSVKRTRGKHKKGKERKE